MNKRLQEAKEILAGHPDVTGIGHGYRYKNGRKLAERCIVIGVKKKRPRREVSRERLIPLTLVGYITDVREMDIRVLPPKPLAFVQRMRPCPPGFSIGHVAISAGTLGAYVRAPDVDGYVILSNNHVLADSNQGKINDKIIQPGKADGGSSQNDLFARLRSFAVIKWDGDNNGGCNLAKRFSAWRYKSRMIEQPYPNLIDAATAIPFNQGHVKLTYPDGSMLTGVKDLELGDLVKKMGRTTEFTTGMVEVVDLMSKVQYGPGQIATYDDQVAIRATEGNFSEPGDSGSAILTMEDKLGGLLFAGGSGVTIANRITHVMSLLGIRI